MTPDTIFHLMGIRTWLAAVGGLALVALTLPAWAEECNFFESDFCFGVNWKTVTTEEIAEVDINARTKLGKTPLYFAAGNNENPAVVEALVKAGANVNARTKFGETPLHLAADNENPAVIETLVKAGADVNAQTKGGWTPLHLAAVRNENPAVIETLVKAGADVSARSKGGWIPLYSAVGNGNSTAIEVLLKAGANPNVKDNRGKTPIDYIDEDENHPLKNTSAYRMLNNARYNFPSDE